MYKPEARTQSSKIKKGLAVAGVSLTASLAAHNAVAQASPQRAMESIPKLEQKLQNTIAAKGNVTTLNGTMSITRKATGSQTGGMEVLDTFSVIQDPLVIKRNKAATSFSLAALERGDFAFGSVCANESGQPVVSLQVYNKKSMDFIRPLPDVNGHIPAIAEQDTLIRGRSGDDNTCGYNYALNSEGKIRMTPPIPLQGGQSTPEVMTQVGFEYPLDPGKGN